MAYFLVAADEHRVQDFGCLHQDNTPHATNPERGVHLSSRTSPHKTHQPRLMLSRPSQEAHAREFTKALWFLSSEKSYSLLKVTTDWLTGAFQGPPWAVSRVYCALTALALM